MCVAVSPALTIVHNRTNTYTYIYINKSHTRTHTYTHTYTLESSHVCTCIGGCSMSLNVTSLADTEGALPLMNKRARPGVQGAPVSGSTASAQCGMQLDDDLEGGVHPLPPHQKPPQQQQQQHYQQQRQQPPLPLQPG